MAAVATTPTTTTHPGVSVAGKATAQLPKNYQKYLNSGHYNATDINDLNKLLAGYNQTDDQLRQQATAAYDPTYQAEKLAQQQKYDMSMQGYQNQLANMEHGYNRQLESTQATFANQLSQMLNNLSKRGMGRSSLVGTGSVAVGNAENAAMQSILNEWNTQSQGIGNNMALAGQQLGESTAQLESSYANQIEARMNELKNANRTASTELQLQIAQMQYQGYLDYLKFKKSNKKSSSSSSKSGSGGTSPSNPSTPSNPGNNDLTGQLEGDKPVRYQHSSGVITS